MSNAGHPSLLLEALRQEYQLTFRPGYRYDTSMARAPWSRDGLSWPSSSLVALPPFALLSLALAECLVEVVDIGIMSPRLFGYSSCLLL